MDKSEKMYEAAKFAREEIISESLFQLDKDNYSGYVFNGLNLSSIASFLIKEAGKCYAYASDMFFCLKRLYELEGADTILLQRKEYRQLIGIRECGVDEEYSIKWALETYEEGVINRYNALYEVEVRQEESGLFEIILYRLNLLVFEYTYEKLIKDFSEEQEEDSGNMPCDTYGMCAGTGCSKYFECQGKE